MRINKKLLIVLLAASVVPSLIFRIIEYRKGQFSSSFAFLESLFFNTLYSIIITLSIAWVILTILYWLNKKVPWSENVLKRLFAEVFTTFPIALLLGYIFGNIFFYVNTYHSQSYSDYIFNFLVISTIMNFILVAISDWFYFFDKWKTSLVENEKEKTKNALLEKENLMAQLGTLKKQMNPHFLFNSLNVLSALIHSSPEKAEEFIDEFSVFYRYVLDQSDKDFVSLDEEINTCKSYLFLQKIRFEDGINCNFNIKDEGNGYYVFPLALQTLLENAIKHNITSKAKPLQIVVSLDNDHLKIENNLQPRYGNVDSTGKGQKNLIKRFRHFNKTPVFKKTSGSYICLLPLLLKSDIRQFRTNTNSYEGFNN